ncbi:MAG: DUF429 domain-containing protein [Nocardioides sp.]|uniref:DUF429 domain-containing protein n=1 Tax=Nocardioides sp. TaxID=35761 RepID=UPI0032647161
MSQQFLGVDLAWSQRARTGVAVVDESGSLVSSHAAVTDGDIDEWISQHAPDARVIAVDAPLIVPNPTGQRVCENLIGKAFGRYNASAHVSNQSKPYFRPPRGFTLAERHGWQIDPDYDGVHPVCLEVYPHPAMVGLWCLESTIPYKAKSGRTVDARRRSFGELLDHLERATPLQLESNARWATIRSSVVAATRQVDLERVEDEIDAIFCAHLAWLWSHDREALQVYGSLADGYIVAPPPPTHTAARRAVTSSSELRSVMFDVVGRPTGFGGSANETAWKKAVSLEASKHQLPANARIGVDFDFRLEPSQQHNHEPDLDNLIKTTIDALDGVLAPRPGNHPSQVDDVRVNEIRARKRFVDDARFAGVSVKVWPSRN